MSGPGKVLQKLINDVHRGLPPAQARLLAGAVKHYNEQMAQIDGKRR